MIIQNEEEVIVSVQDFNVVKRKGIWDHKKRNNNKNEREIDKIFTSCA